MRRVSYTLRGVKFSRTLDRPMAYQMADYLRRTYRIEAEVSPA